MFNINQQSYLSFYPLLYIMAFNLIMNSVRNIRNDKLITINLF